MDVGKLTIELKENEKCYPSCRKNITMCKAMPTISLKKKRFESENAYFHSKRVKNGDDIGLRRNAAEQLR